MDNQTVKAIDNLSMMFPTIERPQIQNIFINECGGDGTKAIVICMYNISSYKNDIREINKTNSIKN